jgi:hypothetical protein
MPLHAFAQGFKRIALVAVSIRAFALTEGA